MMEAPEARIQEPQSIMRMLVMIVILICVGSLLSIIAIEVYTLNGFIVGRALL